jgi:hypothetical protein
MPDGWNICLNIDSEFCTLKAKIMGVLVDSGASVNFVSPLFTAKILPWDQRKKF